MTDLVFHALAAKVHAATEPAGLASIFCNETHVLADYRQAALVGFFESRRTQLVSHSGPVEVDAASAYAQWLADVADHIRQHLDALAPAARVLEYLLLQAALTYGHAWWALAERQRSFAAPWSSLGARRVLRWALSVVPFARTWQRRA